MIEPVPERDCWRTTRGVGRCPAGQETDLASIPRLLWWILGPPSQPRVARAAIEHDYAYRFESQSRYMTRLLADVRFRKNMLADHCPPWKAWLFFWGVRLGGWSSYGKLPRAGRGIDG